MAREYKSTCLLPDTQFAMKADLAQREPAWLQRWRTDRLYDQVLAQPAATRFVFHDGPPYANGELHHGHVLNNVLKDFVTRFRNLAGERTRFVPGWDCHGLPIELIVDRRLGPKKRELTALQVRAECRREAEKWVAVQREQRERLGVAGTWDAPYLTMAPDYEAAVVGALKAFADKGLVYRDRKPVQWCVRDRTALAESEVEYIEQHVSPSVYVKFPAGEAATAALRARFPASRAARFFALIWTTTPWTLPANLAIAAHPAVEYQVLDVEHQGAIEGWIVAAPLAGAVLGATGPRDDAAAARIAAAAERARGADLVGLAFRHPWEDRDSRIVPAEYVETDTGTGLVHTAPGHGRDDYATGRKNGLAPFAPLDDAGRFTDELGDGSRALGLVGKTVWEANPVIVAAMAERGILANRPGATITHKYPGCWRCHSPLITRATVQWFVALDRPMDGGDGATLRQQALAEIDRLASEGEAARAADRAAVGWVPAWGRDRIHGMVAARPDWCISRQRVWGVPIPALHCAACEHATLNGPLLEHVARLFAKSGSDAWFDPDVAVEPPDFACEACGSRGPFRRDQNILDVWFESGSSFQGVAGREDVAVPVDLYLEGSDQHRGWFHSALLIGVAVLGRAPYRAVVTHGFVVDKDGRAYSKSEIRQRRELRQEAIVTRVAAGEGLDAVLASLKSSWATPERAAEARKILAKNPAIAPLAAKIAESDDPYVAPMAVVQTDGAELFRAWTAYEDYQGDVRFSERHFDQAKEAYRKIRNTFRFMLQVMRRVAPPPMDTASLSALDRWAVAQIAKLVASSERHYRRYEFRSVFVAALEYLNDLSAFYLDVVKDWLYNDAADSPRRRSTLAAIDTIVRAMATVLAPILPFTMEDVWDHLPRRTGDPTSVHLTRWPAIAPPADAPALIEAADAVRSLREQVHGVLEPLVQAWGLERQAAKAGGRDPGAGGGGAPGFDDAARIDHARDAVARLVRPAETLARLAPLRDTLAESLVLGDVEIAEGNAPSTEVRRAPGPPCERCRRRRRDVTKDGLCARCAEAVRIFDAQGKNRESV